MSLAVILTLAPVVHRYSCTSKWAKVRATSKVAIPTCVPPTAYGNGSALVFYNSTSYRDDMLWAAAWMYKATGQKVEFRQTTYQGLSYIMVSANVATIQHPFTGQAGNTLHQLQSSYICEFFFCATAMRAQYVPHMCKRTEIRPHALGYAWVYVP